VSASNSAVAAKNGPHWSVRANHRLRTVFFALTLVTVGIHLWGKDVRLVVWGFVALQFLVYPHLVFWRAWRARDSQQAELNNMVIDTALMGMWVAVLQFPLWLGFALWVSTSLNVVISRGAKGMLVAPLAFFGGALLSVALFGLHVSPDTGWPVTLICVIGVSSYLIAIANTAYVRNQQLRNTRERLRLGEQTLNTTNETLQRQLTDIKALQAQLNEQAIRDPLTGLYNRRYLDTRELARCEREAQYLSIVIIDLDHFKLVNDTYGHQGGDEVLKRLATMLLEKIRATDVACRYGGEEFLLLLPNMPQDIGLLRADQWRSAFAAIAIPFGELNIQATLSIGVATYPNNGASVEELIRCADVAMYRAKTEGRNRTVSYREDIH
jgi:diguanylate cyclase